MTDPRHRIDLTELNLDTPTQAVLQRLLHHIALLTAELNELRAENQRLRDEIAQLKGEKGKPTLQANHSPAQATPPDSQPGSRSKSGAPSGQRVPRKERIKIDREQVITLDRSCLPADVEHRGYRDVVVQNLLFTPDTVRYRLERLYANSTGQFYEAALPAALQGQSFGSELHAFVLMLYFEWRVPEEKILHVLQAQGLVISAGQISHILIQKHRDRFAEERKAVLRAGLQTTSYQHIDDTGARVSGVNHYFSTLCNPYYSSFFTHRHKNSDTVAGLLSVLEEPAVRQGSPCPVSGVEAPKEWGDYVPILISDDAPQFRHQTDHQGLCWVHEERHYKKLHPFFAVHQQLVDAFRTDMWDYYDRLKAYATAPTDALKQELSAAFDALFSRTTGYEALDQRIDRTRQKKTELLLVLDFPEVPLENNEAERALREYVIKRKISNGTRTAEGTEAWEVFLSLLDTCRKNGVTFYHYLRDRISNAYQLPALDTLVLAHAQATPG
jgi:Transposase IS66 family